MRLKLHFLAIVPLCLLNQCLWAAEIHVYPGDSIQDAIDLAVDGDEVIVHPGTYYEGFNLEGKAITVRSENPTDPEIVVSTILDANTYGPMVVCINSESSDTVISGFVIANGETGVYASGMWIYGSSPTITHCTFANNIAASSVAPYGGAIWIDDSTSPTFSDCTFDGNANLGGLGGAIFAKDSTVSITNCLFERNNCAFEFYGGAIYMQDCIATLDGCVFKNNTSPEGAGIYARICDLTVNNCTFSNNISNYEGGAIYLNGSSSSTTISDCIFNNNTAEYRGGGIFLNHSRPILQNCTFRYNSVQGSGGGLFIQGDIPILIDSIVCSNTTNQIEGEFDDGGGNIIGDFCPPPQPKMYTCDADVTGDGLVNIDDIFAILSMWGVCP